jgi:AbrB family looped-hinge helix DNA binding protein
MDKKLTHFMTTVKVGPKGQVVIPKEIRDMFGIQPGDSLIMMADSGKGIAIHKQSVMEQIAKAIFDGQGMVQYPKEEA